METLTRDTQLVSYICTWGSNGPTVIRSEMGQVQTAVRMFEGSNLSLLTATGQVFVSHMTPEQTRSLLSRDIEEWNASSKGQHVVYEEFMQSCARVRTGGLARSVGMRNPTWTAFSAPVFYHGKFRMALTVIGVARLFDTRMDGAVAQKLKASAHKMSEQDEL